jgi:hypothetical protein
MPIPAQAEKAVSWARSDLADQEEIAPEQIEVVSVESVEWRNSSLGCPQPGQVYLQVITPGYRIVLRVGEETFEYHAAEDSDRAILCEDNVSSRLQPPSLPSLPQVPTE